jgi:hypothetical protein
LFASIALALGALMVPGGHTLSWTSVFSIDAHASQTIRGRADVCRWNNISWQEMSEDQRKAWQVLGWTDQMWESDQPAQQPPSSSKEWVELSDNERAAAQFLGYRRGSWDNENCRSR